MSLVKIKDSEVDLSFGHIINMEETSNEELYIVRHIDDGQCLSYSKDEVEMYTYYDMLKELMFVKQYNTDKSLQMTKEYLQVDGAILTRTEAVELAKDILEFYEV